MGIKWLERIVRTTDRSTRSLIVAVGLIFGAAVAGGGAEPTGRQALEEEILQGLAKGHDVRLLLEQLAENAPSPRGDRRFSSQVRAELAAGLASLERVLPAAGDAALSGQQLEQVLAAGERVRAADLLMRAHFGTIRDRLEEIEVGGEIFARLATAETSYCDAMDELLGAVPLTAGKAVHGELVALGERLAAQLATPPPPILRGGVLPYRPAGLAPRAPRTEPAVVPSYLNPLAEDPTSADLAATPEAPLDDEILAFAASLDHDYVRIYEYVRNEITSEWYAGSQKGAVGTLRDGSGNDVDQASLLIALFRASQLAARYVHGVVELAVEAVADDLGLSDPAAVPDALARAGVAYTPVIRGGRVATVQVEHTWVDAYLPYSNYRGAVVDYSGRTWLPLAPAVASYEWVEPSGILRAMDLQVDAVLSDYLAAPQPIDLLTQLRDEVEAYLTQNAPGESYEEQLGRRSVVRQELGLLPSSLPMPVVAITGEAPALADEQVVKARFVVRSGVDETSAMVLDGTVALSELSGRRVTLSYIPATVDDHATVNAFGGLLHVPVYLVRVRPHLKINGRPEVVGTGSLEMGVAHRLEVELRGPFGSEQVSQTVVSGSYHALGFGVQGLTNGGLPRQVPDEDDPADTEKLAAQLLSQIALSLNEQWSAAEDELAGLLNVAVLRPLPSVVMVSNAVAVDYALDLPSQLRWTGVTMDAALRIAEPVARGEDAAAARDWMRLSALQGSMLEHRLFESQFLVDSISADKGLGLARQSGVDVLVLDQGESDPRLAQLHHPAAVEEDVANWLRLGMVVEVPVEPITHNAWTGSVWRVEDPATGAGGYLISGGLAGGSTSEEPGDWILEFLRDALREPYEGEPNEDPLAAATIVKMPGTDGQTALVDQYLGKDLAVKVTDRFGRPVLDAEVTFTVLAGGGTFSNAAQVTERTDATGLASISFRLGQRTADNPIYVGLNPGDQHLTRALLNVIEASVRSAQGDLVLETPFTAIAYPRPAIDLRRIDTDDIGFERPGGLWSDTMLIQALDEFDNPVSNVPVTFLVDPYVEEIFECDPPQEDPQNAAVFDLNLLAPPEDVTARVTSERGAYAVGEIVNLTAEVDYRSGKEDILDSASVRLTLLDVNRSVVRASEKILPEMGIGEQASLSFQWSSAGTTPGICQVVIEVLNEGKQIGVATSFLEVFSESVKFTGSLELAQWKPLLGEEVQVSYTVGNYSDRDLVAVPISVSLIDPDRQEILDVFNTAADLEIGQTTDGTASFSTTGLEYKNYWIVLEAELEADLRDEDPQATVYPLEVSSFVVVRAVDVERCPFMVPLIGECGGVEITIKTSHQGAVAGVIMGTYYGSVHTIRVTAPELPSLEFKYLEEGDAVSDIRCYYHRKLLAVSQGFVISDDGENISATRVGEDYRSNLRVTMLHTQWEEFPDMHWARVWVNNREAPPDEELPRPVLITPLPELQVSNGGQAKSFTLIPEGYDPQSGEPPPDCWSPGHYEAVVTAGPEPGLHEVAVGRVREVLRPQTPGSCDFTVDPIVPEQWGTLIFSYPVGEFWGVELTIEQLQPSPAPVTPDHRLEEPLAVSYRLEPAEYRAETVEIDLFENGFLLASARGDSRSDTGIARFGRGLPMRLQSTYEAQVVINRGSPAEVRSDKIPVPVLQGIIRRLDASESYRGVDGTQGVFVSQEVDLLNNTSCGTGTDFIFDLAREARVTLTFWKIDELEPDGSTVRGAEETLINEELYGEGEHHYLILPQDLPAGDYEFELRAVGTLDEQEEVREGIGRSQYRVRNSLPVGHALTHGVDLFDGHLSVVREDLAFPGRGPSLSLTRTYTSQHSDEPGVLGVGWIHSYHSRLIVTPCGEVIIIGGEGSGMRFVDDGDGGLMPLKGYHGTLIANHEDYTYDFYTKAGIRYHYVHTRNENEWYLDYIADPNGNLITLSYEGDYDEYRVEVVRDSAGRSLKFEYEERDFTFWSGKVLIQVQGPYGTSMSYQYDDFGNLIRATREALRSERYGYLVPPDGELRDRHLLRWVEDEVTGASTTYTWDWGAIGLQGDLEVAASYVASLTRSDSGTTSFAYDLSGLSSRAPLELVTQVTDSRNKVSVYTLNQYGSPLRVVDAEYNVTAMTWSADDLVMTSRTDGNGVVTSYTYDGEGNLLSETTGAYTTTFSYWPESAFSSPGIKNRIRESTDRNGVVTSYSYDGAGNLLSETVGDWTIGHTYSARGDRLSTTDRNGKTTSFLWDFYGNLAVVIDPLGGRTESTWDGRGWKLSESDALDRETTFSYDTLGRMTATTLPNGGEKVIVYDDANRTRTVIDPEGRTTVESFDTQGRMTRIVDATGAIKELGYDGEGNKVLETNWHGVKSERAETIFGYDGAGRLISRQEPLGRLTEYGYDGVGNVLSETVSGPGMSARHTEFVYDVLGRQTEERRESEAGTVVTQRSYDGVGNLISETDPLGRTLSFIYDALNRLTGVSGPEGLELTYSYDGNDNLLEETRTGASGLQARTATYDALNRRVSSTDAEGQTTSYAYDAVGNLVRVIDPRNNATVTVYDALDQPVEVTVAGQWTTTYEYDLVGNRITEVWPNGNTLTHTYDPIDRRTSTTDSLGAVVTLEYNDNGDVIRQVDANGNETVTTWDALNRPIAQALPEGRQVAVTYDAAGNRLTQTDPRNGLTTFAYDRLNRLISITDPLNHTAEFAYDKAGNRISETDRRGHPTYFAYDDLNRQIGITDALEQQIVRVYDPLGNLLSETDRRGIVSEYEYDLENRRTLTKRAGLVVERVEYDGNGNPVLVHDARSHTTGFEYDARNLLTAVNGELAAITRFTLNLVGDPVSERDPEGRVTQRTYDLRRRLATETNPASETTTFGYDDNGNLTSIERPQGGVWARSYDGANRLVGVTDPLSGNTVYVYDGNDNLVSVTDAAGKTVTLTYDALNRPLTRSYPGGATEIREYDANGNLTELTDANGQVVGYSYDELNRLIQRDYSEPVRPLAEVLSAIAIAYDANDNPTSISEIYNTGTRTTSRTYDDFDRLISVTDGFGKTVGYGYDANGNRTQLSDPDGEVTQYGYDALNRLTGVTVPGAGVASYSYLRNSLLTKVVYPNGTEAAYTHDGANRVTRLVHTQSGVVPISSFEYSYDDNGNRTEQIEIQGGVSETTSYVYDLGDRLTEVAYPEFTTTYTLDAVGNRLTEQSEGDSATLASRSYAYDDRHRLLAVADLLEPTASITFGYDDNGNLTSRSQGATSLDFRYDVRDQLVDVKQDSISLTQFSYDYQGLRISKQGTAGGIRYVYDDRSVLLQTNVLGDTIARYDYGPDRLLSLHHYTEGRVYYLFDALSSVSNLMGEDGIQVALYQYDAWGKLRRQAGSSWNRFGFTGYERDEETGLYYAKARYYDPEVGRFLSHDPQDGDLTTPPSLHKYLYAYGNPTVNVDPTGEYVETAWDVASFGIGIYSLTQNLEEGNVGGALLDVLGLTLDAVAIALPLVPGGASAGLKGLRALNAGADLMTVSRSARLLDRGFKTARAVDQSINAGLAVGQAIQYAKEGKHNKSALSTAMAMIGMRGAVGNANAALSRGVRPTRALSSAVHPRSSKVRQKTSMSSDTAQVTKPKAGITGESQTTTGTSIGGTTGTKSARPEMASERMSFAPGQRLPDGRIAGDGPGAALRNGPDFVQEIQRITDPRRMLPPSSSITTDPGRLLPPSSSITTEPSRLLSSTPTNAGGVRPHPTDPEIPGGTANYRGRYQAGLSAEELPRLPDDWDVHHSIPQLLRGDPRVGGLDIDHPLQTRGAAEYRQPGSETNVHSHIDQEWRKFFRNHPNATRQE